MAAGDREAIYGVRPEHIHAADEGISGKALLVEGTGSEVFARLDCAGELISCLFRERDLMLQYGQEISIRIDAADVHLFDSASGARLLLKPHS